MLFLRHGRWAFKGQRIVEAALSVLSSDTGPFSPGYALGSLPGTRVLFGGCSAGARGAMFTLDYVAQMARSFIHYFLRFHPCFASVSCRP